MSGLIPIKLNAPVCHVSYYEADAFARWSNARLPRETEWEVIAKSLDVEGHFADANLFDPQPSTKDGVTQIYGDVWEWTQSSFSAYPGYEIAEGAVGEVRRIRFVPRFQALGLRDREVQSARSDARPAARATGVWRRIGHAARR